MALCAYVLHNLPWVLELGLPGPDFKDFTPSLPGPSVGTRGQADVTQGTPGLNTSGHGALSVTPVFVRSSGLLLPHFLPLAAAEVPQGSRT